MVRSITSLGRVTGPLRRSWYTSTTLSAAPFLLAVTVLGRAAQNIGQTTFPLEGRELLHIGNGPLGVIAAVSGLAGVVMAATFGARVTTTSSLAVLTVGQAMILMAFIALALPVGGEAGLWTGAVLIGSGGGLVFPATMTAVGGAAKGGPSRPLAVYALALSTGLVVGPLIESGILHLMSQSLRATFVALLPVPAAATMIAALAAARHALHAHPDGTAPRTRLDGVSDAGRVEAPGHDATSAGAGEVGSASEVRHAGNQIAPYPRRKALLRQPAYRLSLAIMLTYQAPFSALVAFGGLFAHHVDGASAAGVELGFAVFFGVSFLARAAFVYAAPIHRVSLWAVPSAVATVVGVAILGLGHGLDLLLLAMAVLGAPHGLTLPLASSVLAENIGARDLGRANARLMASTNCAAVAVPLVCGWLADAVGYSMTFVLIEVPVGLFGALLAAELIHQSSRNRDPVARRGRHDDDPGPWRTAGSLAKDADVEAPPRRHPGRRHRQ